MEVERDSERIFSPPLLCCVAIVVLIMDGCA